MHSWFDRVSMVGLSILASNSFSSLSFADGVSGAVQNRDVFVTRDGIQKVDSRPGNSQYLYDMSKNPQTVTGFVNPYQYRLEARKGLNGEITELREAKFHANSGSSADVGVSTTRINGGEVERHTDCSKSVFTKAFIRKQSLKCLTIDRSVCNSVAKELSKNGLSDSDLALCSSATVAIGNVIGKLAPAFNEPGYRKKALDGMHEADAYAKSLIKTQDKALHAYKAVDAADEIGRFNEAKKEVSIESISFLLKITRLCEDMKLVDAPRESVDPLGGNGSPQRVKH